jgi:hypothetical protein
MSVAVPSESRRAFLGRAACAAALLAAHDSLLAQGGPPARSPLSGEHLIRGIRLLTAVPLAEMRAFYEGKLGFEVAGASDEEISFLAGATRLTFARATEAQGAPFYHVAFNIPRNKLLAAREWHLKRWPLIETPEHQRDTKYPNDVRHFPNWNAHSLFFWDPAFNILEFIARHDLANDSEGEFTSRDIHYASEIGLVVEEPGVWARRLHESFGLNEYPRGTANWWAMGDERGLLLCLPKGRVFGENTRTPKAFDVFPTEVEIEGGSRGMEFEGLPYRVKRE